MLVATRPFTRLDGSIRAGAAQAALSVCSSIDDEDLCLPCGLARMEAHRPGGRPTRRLKRGDDLYLQGDEFRAIYAVRAGSFKSVLQAPDGLEQVISFGLVGDILGLDGLARGRHESTATALEDSEVLVLSYDDTSWWPGSPVALHYLVSRLLSRELVKGRVRIHLISHRSAETRLAALLLDVSQRMQARGYSNSEFHLRLTRQEIGSYLGLKLETVSRGFAGLQQQRVLDVDGKHVRLLNLPALELLAGEGAD